MPSFAQAVYALWLREFKVFTREKSRLISTVISPLLLVAVIGTGFGATTTFVDEEYASIGYERFMFPGIIAVTILFGSVFYGLNIVWDRKLDVLKEVLVAPVPRSTIFLGKVLGGCTSSLIQATMMLILGVIFFDVSVGGALLGLVFVLLLTMAFVAVGLFLGSFFDSFEGFQLIVSFLVMPLVFLSGAFYPVEGLPAWLAAVTFANPATYAVDGLRGALVGAHAVSFAVDAAVLAAFAGLFLALGAWSFRRMT